MQTVYSQAFLELILNCELFRRLCVCEVATAMLQTEIRSCVMYRNSQACMPWSPEL